MKKILEVNDAIRISTAQVDLLHEVLMQLIRPAAFWRRTSDVHAQKAIAVIEELARARAGLWKSCEMLHPELKGLSYNVLSGSIEAFVPEPEIPSKPLGVMSRPPIGYKGSERGR